MRGLTTPSKKGVKMKLLGIDFETTSADIKTARILEMGLVVYDTDKKAPIFLSSTYLRDNTYPKLEEKIIELTGITQDMLDVYSFLPEPSFMWLLELISKSNIDYIIGHNIRRFDLPLLENEFKRFGMDYSPIAKIDTIDTMTDLPLKYAPDSRKLKYLACDHGFVPSFQHRALFDVLTTFQILENYSIEEIKEYKKVPFIVVRANVTYDDREKAKAERYSWERIGEAVFPKSWVKEIKQNKLEEEKAKCPFQVIIVG